MLINQDFTQERLGYLGGSDIGAILGVSPYKTAMDVWLEKTGQAKTQASSLPLRFGQYAEDFIAKEYANLTQQNVVQHLDTIKHKEYDFLTGHIDRFICDSDKPLFNKEGQLQARTILECKTANPFLQYEWGDTHTDEVPLTYLVQCLWYLIADTVRPL